MTDRRLRLLGAAISAAGAVLFAAQMSHADVDWDAGVSLDVVREAEIQLPKADEKRAWGEERVKQTEVAQAAGRLDQLQDIRPIAPAPEGKRRRRQAERTQYSDWRAEGVAKKGWRCKPNGSCVDADGYYVPGSYRDGGYDHRYGFPDLGGPGKNYDYDYALPRYMWPDRNR